MIRSACPVDASAIAAIWNLVIRDTVATFTTVEKTPAAIAELISAQPFWVAEDAGKVAGFATYAQFRAGTGYAQTMEHSVHVALSAQGKGLGRSLMTAVEHHARKAGVHSLLAAISGENANGIAFHIALGYALTARLPLVGRKFGRWHDLVLMQKFL